MHLFDISFPIFSITEDYKRIWEDMNVLYIETYSGVYILDNKNIEGDTLGKRRIKLNADNKYMPRRIYNTLAQMIRSNKKHFIDNTGTIFKYKKTEFVPLKYHKIKSINRYEGECLVEVKDIYFPQKLNCRLAHSINYLGVLHTKFGYILYSFEEEFKKDTRRKI